jgi:hypothetical protein
MKEDCEDAVISVSRRVCLNIKHLQGKYPDENGNTRTPSKMIEYVFKKAKEWEYIP